MKIFVPAVQKCIFKETGCKNSIYHLLETEKEITGEIIKTEKHFFSFECGEDLYCFTTDKKKIDLLATYVLLIEKITIEENINVNEIVIKCWLKHPLLSKTFTNEEILNSWSRAFNFIEENIETDEKGLRRPQIGALYSILSHLKVPNNVATVVMPTGTGKTETMLSTLIAAKCEKLLITVPSDSLRTQIANKFIKLGLLKEFGVVNSNALFPKVGLIFEKFSSKESLEEFLKNSNVIVTTMNILSRMDKTNRDLLSKYCTNVFIDEAHHVKASSWEDVRKTFDDSKVIQFTATPFRNDGKNLDGKIIFNYPLEEAQKEGYFTEIEFIPVKEYDSQKVDRVVATKAIERLINDRDNDDFPHILMARCSNKSRALQVFEIYKELTENTNLIPAVIYSGIENQKKIYQEIINKKYNIIVCVDMLGEGFDLPELKVAALHDIRKSLPITLQFIGRFTRTKHDEKLGKAAFIANIADLEVTGVLEDLYSNDANWNNLISNISSSNVDFEMEYKDFLAGFKNITQANFAFKNIHPKLSTVVYKGRSMFWSPLALKDYFINNTNYEYAFFDINQSENMVVITYAKKNALDWLNDKNTFNLSWTLIILIWDPEKELLYINSSDNSSLYKELSNQVIDQPILISGMEVFKSLYNINRLKLQNVGMKLFLAKDIRYRMSVGSDLSEAIPLMEKQRSQKSYVVGTGFENGEPVNIGCSYKGRIWTKLQGNLMSLKNWCNNIGEKLSNSSIDPNQVLVECLVPKRICVLPNEVPISIDWDYEVYMEKETKFRFKVGHIEKNLSAVELHIKSFEVREYLEIELKIEEICIPIKFTVFNDFSHDDEEGLPNYKFEVLSEDTVFVEFGSKRLPLIDFFDAYTPTIWFADGSSLTGNDHIILKHQINLYNRELLIPFDWTNVDISKESQRVNPKIEDSIQYRMIQYLKEKDYTVIYDDDGSGEIADIVTIEETENELKIQLYHLKYASNGRVSEAIANLYEVCGQAQKSTQWKYKSGKEFFSHLLRRHIKTYSGQQCSRLERGNLELLETLKDKAKKKIPMSYEIFIVQPSISKENVQDDILTLLGVTENFIKETTGIDLKVICSY
ncbi:DEAD/DEAH box helicase [Bacillus paranthracis]|uniref:DEAD/DEAH box helicase n=1 Tax=Bacillus paranthracis TaxID=2026186 RepID=UPI001E3CB1BA|nr:DEAD/DEAH box helicase family protein [Bacillus paranthracis]MCC2374988.1 DEAD/DEAH box helicase family protein [Bacillus paranthracis]